MLIVAFKLVGFRSVGKLLEVWAAYQAPGTRSQIRDGARNHWTLRAGCLFVITSRTVTNSTSSTAAPLDFVMYAGLDFAYLRLVSAD